MSQTRHDLPCVASAYLPYIDGSQTDSLPHKARLDVGAVDLQHGVAGPAATQMSHPDREPARPRDRFRRGMLHMLCNGRGECPAARTLGVGPEFTSIPAASCGSVLVATTLPVVPCSIRGTVDSHRACNAGRIWCDDRSPNNTSDLNCNVARIGYPARHGDASWVRVWRMQTRLGETRLIGDFRSSRRRRRGREWSLGALRRVGTLFESG